MRYVYSMPCSCNRGIMVSPHMVNHFVKKIWKFINCSVIGSELVAARCACVKDSGTFIGGSQL